MTVRKLIQFLWFIILMFCSFLANAQNSFITVDTTSLYHYSVQTSFAYHPPVFSSRENILERELNEGDLSFIKSKRQLIQSGPNYKNYENYSELAAALYRKGELATAKKMFLIIVSSKELYYTGTIFHSANNRYEYGSYTTNFKHDACEYLCKLFIGENNYQQALHYLIKAEKIHPLQYNCGTSYNFYKNRLNSLYVACYTGLNNLDKVIALYLKEAFYYDERFIEIIKKKYTTEQINRQLSVAKDKIVVVKDNFETTEYMRNKADEDSLTARYTNGKANTFLFGHKVQLPVTRLSNGETITRQHYIDSFINSDFYTTLSGIKKPGDNAGL